MPESKTTKTGGDREEVPSTLAGPGQCLWPLAKLPLRLRAQPGAYRLFVYVHDDRGHAGHANIPFQVKN